MKRVWRLSGLVFLVMASLVSFACSGEEDESGPFSKFFSRYHKAAIGTVSKLDKDKKGYVTREEMFAAFRGGAGAPGAPAKKAGG